MILLNDHPEIQSIERTGFPSWMQPEDEEEENEDEDISCL